MKFLNQQLNEQMQVWSFLMNFKNEDEDEEISEEIKECYKQQGKDYETEQKRFYEQQYKYINPFLLKHLPESLRYAICDEF